MLGCTPTHDGSLQPGKTELRLFWPLPPETPRIQYLRSIAAPQDLGIKKSFFRKVAEFFVGQTEERIQQPYGIAVDPEERIYIADSALRVVHVFDLGKGRYRAIRGAGKDEFQFPLGVTLDSLGRLYVSDVERRAVFGLNRRGKGFLRISAGLQRPTGLAYNPQNDLLYVVDTASHEIHVYDLAGKPRFAFGGRGDAEGQLNFPTNIAVDREGTLYVTDSMNFRVQLFQPDGTFISQFGRLGDALGDLARPKGISVDSEGHVYVVEGLYDVINVYDREGGRLLLTFGGPGRGPGEFWLATGLFIDARDRIYMADSYNSRIQVFQYLKETAQQ
jgi:DNA-binding beta-propeller fold protein YncE